MAMYVDEAGACEGLAHDGRDRADDEEEGQHAKTSQQTDDGRVWHARLEFLLGDELVFTGAEREVVGDESRQHREGTRREVDEDGEQRAEHEDRGQRGLGLGPRDALVDHGRATFDDDLLDGGIEAGPAVGGRTGVLPVDDVAVFVDDHHDGDRPGA